MTFTSFRKGIYFCSLYFENRCLEYEFAIDTQETELDLL